MWIRFLPRKFCPRFSVHNIEGRKVVFTRSISKGQRVSLRRTDEHIVLESRGASNFGMYAHGHLVTVVAKIESAA